MNKLISTVFTLVLYLPNSYAMAIPLHLASIEDSPSLHKYFHELLTTSIQNIGHEPKLIIKNLPHLRVKQYLKNGEISIHWMLKSDVNNKTYIPINVGLTDGLIGQRVLFIKKNSQHLYDEVKNLEDFRDLNLVGAIGKDWFDVKVRKLNKLSYEEHSGNWKSIFTMLRLRTIYDYFSRGLNEILTESKLYPNLAIEKNLLLIYDRDFIFYLSKTGNNNVLRYKSIIEEALLKAKKDGLIKKLLNKYRDNDFKTLNYDTRLKLYLKTP